MEHNGPRIWGPIDTNAGYRVKFYCQFDEGKYTDRTNAVVTFKYGDILQRAINFRKNCTDETEQVKVTLCMYQIKQDVYMGVDPLKSATYGTVSSKKRAGRKKLTDLIREAVEAGIHVTFIGHQFSAVKNTLEGITNLNRIAVTWGADCNGEIPGDYKIPSDARMHNKFILASHLQGANASDTIHRNCVYVASANIDSWKGTEPKRRWHQTGVTVYGHPGLYEAYGSYADLISANKDDRGEFTDQLVGNNVYSDGDIRAYFYPIKESSRWWDTALNPVAKCFEDAGSAANNYCKMVQAYIRGDFTDEIRQVVGTNFNTKVYYYSEKATTSTPNKASWRGVKLHKKRLVHSKNYQFSYKDAEGRKRISMTGSTNAKKNAFTQQANTILALADASGKKVIYNVFKAIYERADKQKPH